MDFGIITSRRSEIEREMADLHDRLAKLKAEMEEIAIAERLIARLSGSQIHKDVKPSNLTGMKLTIREMIKAALMDARQKNLPGLLPKDIRAYIANIYNTDIGQQVNTTASKMWHDYKEIAKDEKSGLFYLPKENPADDTSLETPSTGSDGNPEHRREDDERGGGAA